MSLSGTASGLKYNLGILASKDFDSRDLLWDTLSDKLETIRHVYTNGVNPLVMEFARNYGIPYTVYPVHGGRGLPASTHDVVDASDFVLVIATPESKSVETITKICAEKVGKPLSEGRIPFKWRVIPYEPYSHWCAKVQRIGEIVGALGKDELATNEWARAVAKEAGNT